MHANTSISNKKKLLEGANKTMETFWTIREPFLAAYNVNISLHILYFHDVLREDWKLLKRIPVHYSLIS